MSIQLAQLEIPAHAIPYGKADRAIAENTGYPERPLAAARGIINALLLAAPFWALCSAAVYLLI